MFLVPHTRLFLVAVIGIGALIGCSRSAPQPAPGLIIHTHRPLVPGILVFLDSIPFSLDTAAGFRTGQDELLRTLDGRTIDSIRFLTPDSAMKVYGSRAYRGVLRVWTRRNAP